MSDKDALLKAAEIAKIKLSEQAASQLIREIDEVLGVFSKIDEFQVSVTEETLNISRPLRKDKEKKCKIDPFSNTNLIEKRKFIGPRLVD